LRPGPPLWYRKGMDNDATNQDPIARRARQTVLEHVAYAIEQEMPMAPVEPVILDGDVRVHRVSFPGHSDLYVRTTVDVLTQDEFRAYLQEQLELEAFRRAQPNG
jgi:hypothetical protein